MLTSFTRIIIVLHFVRTAIGTQTAPPNQVLVGLALFLTLFIMWPTFSEINEKAIKPLDEGTITQQEAIQAAEEPFREFMYGQTQTKDLKLFVDMSGETYDDYDDVPFTTLVPALLNDAPFLAGHSTKTFITLVALDLEQLSHSITFVCPNKVSTLQCSYTILMLYIYQLLLLHLIMVYNPQMYSHLAQAFCITSYIMFLL